MMPTRDEIENMPADGMTDAAVWMYVFKGGTVTGKLPKFSSDISAAWEVAEKINQMITDGHLTLENDFNYLTLEFLGYNSGYAVSFDCIVDDNEWYEQGTIEKYKYAARAETAPLAICRAALLAVQSASPTHDLP